MLIEFTVSNFRSFREAQTLSMVAAPRLHKKENTFQPMVAGEKLPPLLKIVAVYGPNASGKSNLIKALGTIRRILLRSSPSEESALAVSPFRFDPDLKDKPSQFEVHFIADGIRYQFNLGLTQDRVTDEVLYSFPKGKESLLYRRHFNGHNDDYEFGTALEGGRDLHEAWRRLTAPKTLFIAQAVANSNEELKQLRAPLKWFRNGVMSVDRLSGWAGATQTLIESNPSVVESVSNFLKDMDVPVTRFKVEKLTDGPSFEHDEFRTTLTHKSMLGEADFSFEEESEGTKGLIGFWLPWSLIERKADYYHVLAIDELDSSLHPQIVANVIARYLAFDSPAQLIFTTHDTHLMDTKLLRRDQFWLTERDKNAATVLRSIYDFAGREGEDIEKRYYEGRYRSLPIVRRS